MKLKVCGMKYQNNIQEVANLQPDYLGFIFYEKSARYFDGIIPELPKSIKKVGVFVNATLDFLLEKIKEYDLNVIQLHGDEDSEFCKNLKEASTPEEITEPLKIVKVFAIKDDFDFSILKPFEMVCDYFLFDTKGPLPGGNGISFNWNVLLDYPSTKPYFLSGGIGLDEMDSILLFLNKRESKHCMAIDVNSKFEVEPGLKDIRKLEKFKNELQY